MKDVIHELAANPKVAHAAAMATTSTGIGTLFDVIPDDIGKLATLVGIILSSVLIYTHARRWHMDSAKNKLELEILKERRREQLENAAKRRRDD